MANLMNQIESNKKRLLQLQLREERLIQATTRNGYVNMILTQSGLQPNPKEAQYLRLLKEIHAEKVGLWLFNQENNKKYAEHLQTAKGNIAASLTKSVLFNLTAPR